MRVRMRAKGTQSRTRQCLAMDCGVSISGDRIWCAKHWQQVPTVYRHLLVAAYPAGWLDDEHPGTPEWYRVLYETVRLLASSEGT